MVKYEHWVYNAVKMENFHNFNHSSENHKTRVTFKDGYSFFFQRKGWSRKKKARWAEVHLNGKNLKYEKQELPRLFLVLYLCESTQLPLHRSKTEEMAVILPNSDEDAVTHDPLLPWLLYSIRRALSRYIFLFKFIFTHL